MAGTDLRAGTGTQPDKVLTHDGAGNIGTGEGNAIPGVSVGIESGSNAAGDWVRFADGTQICNLTFNITIGSRIGDFNWTYPQNFKNPSMPYLSVALPQGSRDYGNGNDRYKISTAGYVIADHDNAIIRVSAIISETFSGSFINNIMVTAIGRWK